MTRPENIIRHVHIVVVYMFLKMFYCFNSDLSLSMINDIISKAHRVVPFIMVAANDKSILPILRSIISYDQLHHT